MSTPQQNEQQQQPTVGNPAELNEQELETVSGGTRVPYLSDYIEEKVAEGLVAVINYFDKPESK